MKETNGNQLHMLKIVEDYFDIHSDKLTELAAKENGPFDKDAFPTENGDFPASDVSLLEGTAPKISTIPRHPKSSKS